MSSCKLCVHPKIDYIDKEVLSGRKTIQWGAEQLGVSYQMYWQHCKNHVAAKEEDMELPETLSNMLDEMIQELYKRFKKVIGLPVERGNEAMLRDLVNSFNTCLMNLARLKRLINEAPLVQVQQFNVQMTKLIEFLHTELPPEYQQKVEAFLESLAR